MQFTGAQQKLQFDKWNDRLYPIGTGGGIGAEVMQTLFEVGISQARIWQPNQNLTLNNDDTLWVWAHGNRHRDAIAAGNDSVLMPGELADLIAEKLPIADTGHIIVWTCWGGAPGGFVEHFAAIMRAIGYNNLHMWGATAITGVMSRDNGQWADLSVWADRQNINVGLDLAGGPVGLRYGGGRFAVRADMRGFGPGLAAPHYRAFEV